MNGGRALWEVVNAASSLVSAQKYLILAIMTRIFQPNMLSCDKRLEAENGLLEYPLQLN